METSLIYIYGKHAVREALTMRPDTITRLFIRDEQKGELSRTLLNKVPKVQTFSGNKVPSGVDKKAVHQGFIAELDQRKLTISYNDFITNLAVTNDTAVAVLGELEDPHNVGAVIRSAAAFGISAVCIPKHRQVGVTGTVVKVSAGMAFQVPLVEVPNVNRLLEDLKKKGFFVYGLDGGGEASLHTESFNKPSVFVLGNEGEGIREKTKEHCDFILHIPMDDRCESLNASVSAAVTFYQWSVQHPNALS